MASGYRSKKMRGRKRHRPTGQVWVTLLNGLKFLGLSVLNFLKFCWSAICKAAAWIWKIILLYIYYPLLRFAKGSKIKLRQLRQKFHIKWKQTFKSWTKNSVSIVRDGLTLAVYGLLVNYVFWFFTHSAFNIKSVIAFGLAVYFVKYELVALILKILGPKIPGGVVR